MVYRNLRWTSRAAEHQELGEPAAGRVLVALECQFDSVRRNARHHDDLGVGAAGETFALFENQVPGEVEHAYRDGFEPEALAKLGGGVHVVADDRDLRDAALGLRKRPGVVRGAARAFGPRREP
jgi:hypothetical protein